MKKVIFSFILALGTISYQANAQSNIGAHISTALPVGDFGEATDFGIGGGLTYDYYFNNHFNLGLEAEYINFAFNDIDASVNLIPVMVTSAYHSDFGNEIDLYGGLGVGAMIKTFSIDAFDTETDLAISPRIGLAYELGNRLYLDVSLRYALVFDAQEESTTSSGGFTITQEAVGNTGFVGLNIGILYTLAE
jgi:outer membrane protein W